jgi:hypothetical protein
MPLFKFFRSPSPQLDIGDENDPSGPSEGDTTAASRNRGDGTGRKRSRFCNRRTSSLAERAPRNSTLFFGFCDMRIATVLLNILHVVFTFLLEVVDTSNWTDQEVPLLAIIGFIFSGLAMFGALNFNIFAMSAATIGSIALFCLYVSEIHLFGGAILCVVLYAQIVLIIEMRKGIMTKETYAEQEFIVAEGRQALEKAHSYATDVAETSKVVALEVRQSSRTLFTRESVPVAAEC